MIHNNKFNKYEEDEWNCPLTPQDIAIRQSPSFLSKTPKEDILTKKINTQPPKHEFWQSHISTPLVSLTSLAVVFGSVSAYLYFKFVPIIENSLDFNSLVLRHEKNAIHNLRKHKLQRKTTLYEKEAFLKKTIRTSKLQNITNSNIQRDTGKRNNLFNLETAFCPIPLLLQKSKQAENIYRFRNRENLLLINH